MSQAKPTYRIALFGTALAVAVIMLGAFTRLVDAGLGCPDWPGCYGHLAWPTTETEIAVAEQAFPDAPVELDKTWPEMVHRYFASSLGLIAIALVVGAFRHRREEGQPFKLPLILLAVIILQGMFGMWTVTLKLWPQVVTGHLLGGFITITLFWLLAMRLSGKPWPAMPQRLQGLRKLAVVSLLLVFLQIALGGWTTSNYAAVACPDLPQCQGQWLPEMDFENGFNVMQHIGPNYLGGKLDNESRVAIHFAHRVGAIIVFLAVLMLTRSLYQQARGYRPAQKFAGFLLLVLMAQVVLGLSNIIFHFPVAIAVGHNAGGALLLVTMATLVYRLYFTEARER